ncbi:DUF3098 domain-containing protein [Hymenobacter sp. BT683]|uniref:DUF3098 domain-containing protein n=1 Tax=Hymenobacter jeongseonensis TaxID=2791027 RepID=A0ABS0IIF9_9BACT|nr:DUF3098 domain-containing protein [Hymenobacter jeongseonensis]MBF9238158.1 DUF3098 domain-containing protein [Hymenobacter jeongseonensis]
MTPTNPAPRFAFGPRNYRLMWLGLAVLAAGFITMMFGDKENYGEDFVGITLGPLLLIAGFGIEFAAIMVRDKTLNPAPIAPATSLGTTTEPVTQVAPAAPAAPAYKRL